MTRDVTDYTRIIIYLNSYTDSTGQTKLNIIKLYRINFLETKGKEEKTGKI